MKATGDGGVVGKNYGKETITVTSLSGEVTFSFEVTVVSDKVYFISLSSKKKGQIALTYYKDKTVSGYEVAYATNEKFTKNKKTKTVSKASITKVTLSKLKSGKKYLEKIRPYVLVNGKKIYGEYRFTELIWVK